MPIILINSMNYIESENSIDYQLDKKIHLLSKYLMSINIFLSILEDFDKSKNNLYNFNLIYSNS
jgi:hypothetical protein